MPKFVPYSDSVEVIADDERETFQQIIDLMLTGQHNVREKYGRSVRVSHAKAHAFLKGTLTVNSNLPTELAQGLFAQAGTHDVVVRMAQAPGEVLDDTKVSSPRGMAIKIFNVTGPKLPGHEANNTQDLLLSTGKAFIVGGAKAFKVAFQPNALIAPKLPESVKGLTSDASRATNAVLGMFGINSGKLDFYGHPRFHPLAEAYYSQSAFRYGDYIAKIAAIPANPDLQAMYEKTIELTDENGLRTATTNYFSTKAAEFTIAVQLSTDIDKMPVEDASVEWSETLSPYIPVGKLMLPAQNAFDSARQDMVDQTMSFSIDHSLAAHRPLGSLNRARMAVYPALSKARIEENQKTMIEPTNINEIPA